MNFLLKDKTILITGASSGIGKQCAIDCSREGARLALTGRDKERLENIRRELSGEGHSIHILDLKNREGISALVESVYSIHGRISGFVHSAGIEMTLPLASMKTQHQEEIYSINVIAAFEFARLLSQKKYLDPEGSSFVFIASIMSILGQAGKTAYCASKGALVSGARAMALELVSKRIRVNTISPAIVKTPLVEKLFETLSEESIEEIIAMHPMGLGSPEDIAQVCTFLLSEKSKWITGSNLIVDGGYSIR